MVVQFQILIRLMEKKIKGYALSKSMNQLKELQYIHNIITAVFIISIIGLFFEITRLSSAIFIILVWASNVVWGGCIMTQAEDRLRKLYANAKRRTPFLNTFIQKILHLNITLPNKSIKFLMTACACLAVLQVVSAANPYLLMEGDRLTIDVNDTHYVLVDVELVSTKGALILLNGEDAGIVKEGDWITYDDGSQIHLSELLVSDGSLDYVEIYVNAKTAFVKPGKTPLSPPAQLTATVNIIGDSNDSDQNMLVDKIELVEEKELKESIISNFVNWLRNLFNLKFI